jgi:cytochrome b561
MSRVSDTKDGYGWASIALHWLSAVIVFVLWMIGSSIRSAGAAQIAALQLHTSIAASAWLLLWWRIVRRVRHGHPAATSGRASRWLLVGKLVHYAMLVALAAMLLSGPLMVWSRGAAIHVFGLTIPAPFAADAWFAGRMYLVHSWGGSIIALGTALHLAGVFKHVAINRDRTLDRMLIAAKQNQPREAAHCLSARSSAARTS